MDTLTLVHDAVKRATTVVFATDATGAGAGGKDTLTNSLDTRGDYLRLFAFGGVPTGVLTATGTGPLQSIAGVVSTYSHPAAAVLTVDGAGQFSAVNFGGLTTKFLRDDGGFSQVGAGDLSGGTLAAGVTASSLTSVGTLTVGVWQGTSIGTAYTDAKVVSISGTANRISIGGTATVPVVDISAAYVGQATITTLGTIATGVWSGTALVAGKVPAITALNGYDADTTHFLRGDATWTTVPASAISGGATLSRTNDTNVTVTLGGSPTTALLAATSLTLGWTGQLAETRGGTAQATYTQGDLLYASAANTLSKLAIGTANKVLTSSGSIPQWSTTIAYAALPTGNGSWDTGVGTTITVTRSLTVSGTLTGTLTGSITGSAATLSPGRNINGVLFDGSAAITVTAAAGTLTGTVLNATVVTSSLTTVGTIGTGVWQGTIVGTAYLGTGTQDTTTFLRGDGTWSSTLTSTMTARVFVAGTTGSSLTPWSSSTGDNGPGGPLHTFTIASATTGQTFADSAAASTFSFSNPVVITSTGATQFKVAYDGSNHYTAAVSSAGAVTFNATGASAAFTFSDAVTVPTFTATTSNLGTVATGLWNGTIIGTAYLGTGTQNTATVLRGDGTWDNSVSGGWLVGGAVRVTTNNTAFQGVSTLGVTRTLIKLNASDLVDIDTSGLGVLFGGSITTDGNVTAGVGTGGRNVLVDGGAGNTRDVRWRSGSVDRWGFRVTSTAEGGADAGSNFQFRAHDDTGTLIDNVFTVSRAAGSIFAFNREVSLASLSKLYLDAGGDSYLVESAANTVDVVAGGTTAISATATGVRFAGGLALSAGTRPSNGIAFGTSAPGTLANGQMWYDGTVFQARLAGATKQFFTAADTIPSANISGSYTGITGVGTLTVGTWSATSIDATHGGTAQSTWTKGDLLYSSASNTLAKLAGNITVTKKFLNQTGDGAASAAPSWDALVAADIPSLAASKITSGTLALAQGGTNADLSASGSATAFLAQDAAHAITARALVAGDVPNLDASKITTGTMATARLGSGSADSTTFLRGDQTYSNILTGSMQAGSSGTTAFAMSAAAGAAGSAVWIQKTVTGIANNTLTTVLTVTCPNTAQSSQALIWIRSSLGAGDAIGVDQAAGQVQYMAVFTRTAGKNLAGTLGVSVGSISVAVAGATATMTTNTLALAAVVGAVGASNTMAIQVTIARSAGASTNHFCDVVVCFTNRNATGMTIA